MKRYQIARSRQLAIGELPLEVAQIEQATFYIKTSAQPDVDIAEGAEFL